MSFNRNLTKLSLSFAMLALVSVGAHADGLGLGGAVKGVTSGLGGAVGGITSGLGGTVGGVTSGLGGTVSGVTSGLGLGSSSTSTSSVASNSNSNSILGSNSLLGGVASNQTNVLNLVKAKLKLLNQKELLGACATAGASGCNGATRIKLLNLVDSRLGLLSGGQLLSLCVSVGGGCGGGGTNPNPPHHSPDPGPDRTASNAEGKEAWSTCQFVINHASLYDPMFVRLCRQSHN